MGVCAKCEGRGWYVGHEAQCYEHGCSCSGVQVQCECGESAASTTDCPNGPDRETGEWPCERGADDSCLTCGWTPEPNPSPSSGATTTEGSDV